MFPWDPTSVHRSEVAGKGDLRWAQPQGYLGAVWVRDATPSLWCCAQIWMLLRLSDDELRSICDFLQSAVLSHTCRRTWSVLQRRYVCWYATPDRVAAMMSVLARNCKLRQVSLLCSAGVRLCDAVGLKDAVALTSLDLDLSFGSIAPPDVQALGALKEAPSLTSLSLDLSYSECLDDSRYRALAGLKDAASLKTLCLKLCRADAGFLTGGFQALAALKDAPSLTFLDLDLSHNFLIDVRTLSALKYAPSLTTLDLNLCSTDLNLVPEVGAHNWCHSLAQLKDAPALTSLYLNLSYEMIDDYVQALMALKDAPKLTTLGLDLSEAEFSWGQGAAALAALKDAPVLSTLGLSLCRTGVQDAGLQALGALRSSQALTKLSLDVSGNDISHVGLQALAGLRDAPSLAALYLNLSQTSLPSARRSPVRALAALKDAPALTTLGLDMSGTGVQVGDVRALAVVTTAPKPIDFSVNLWGTGLGEIDLASLQGPPFRSLHVDLSDPEGDRKKHALLGMPWRACCHKTWGSD